MRTNRKIGLSKTQWLLLFLIPIFIRGCFWYVGIPYEIEKVLALIVAVSLIGFFFCYVISTRAIKHTYGEKIKIILFLSFLSILNAFIYWGQNPILTFSSGFGIYIYIYYYLLWKYHPDENQISKLLIVFTCLYAVLWLYALSMAPETVFGNKDEIDDKRGMFRISLEGLDAVGLLFFYSLVQFFSSKKKLRFLSFAIVSFLLIFATLSRMMIVAVSVVTFFYVIRKQSLKIILIVSMILALGWGTVMQNEIVNNLIELQEMQSDDPNSDKLIRNEYTDCFKLFPFNIGTFLFGNGSDHISSSYGKREDKLKSDYGFNRSDAGYPGFYVTYGIVSLLIFIFIFIKALLRKIPDEFYYCKLYLLFFMIASITTNHFVTSGFALMIVFYILDSVTVKERLCK